jgi:tetratricopeptide (TPR) repeat protein
MNIVAFILAIAGAVLSLFCPALPMVNFIFFWISVLLVAIVAVTCGTFVFMRKQGKIFTIRLGENTFHITVCIIGLAVCVILYLLASLISVGMFLLWGLLYLASAVCAYLDISADTSSSFSFAPTRNLGPLFGIQTSALIKRGQIFLSDDEFAEAERYFEQALRQDPENSQAYLGKLMALFNVHDTNELSTVPSPIGEEKLFKRTMEFADEKGKSVLLKCLKDNDAYISHIEAMNREAKYQEALHEIELAETHSNFHRLRCAQRLFEEIGDYKDSISLNEEIAEILAEEEAKRAEKIAEVTAKTKNSIRKLLTNPFVKLYAFLALLLLTVVLFFYNVLCGFLFSFLFLWLLYISI